MISHLCPVNFVALFWRIFINIYLGGSRPSCISLLTFFLWIPCKIKTKNRWFYHKFRGFSKLSKIEFCYEQIFENSIIHKPSVWSQKFGPDRFSHFDFYWIQTNKQTSKVILIIEKIKNMIEEWMKMLFDRLYQKLLCQLL